jgi:hypothetical protein
LEARPEALKDAPEEGQWLDPSFEYALPHALVVIELATKLEEVADRLGDAIGA